MWYLVGQGRIIMDFSEGSSTMEHRKHDVGGGGSHKSLLMAVFRNLVCTDNLEWIIANPVWRELPHIQFYFYFLYFKHVSPR
jgi:hypothetical protein